MNITKFVFIKPFWNIREHTTRQGEQVFLPVITSGFATFTRIVINSTIFYKQRRFKYIRLNLKNI